MQNSNNDLWPVIMAGGSRDKIVANFKEQQCQSNFVQSMSEETLFYKTLEKRRSKYK